MLDSDQLSPEELLRLYTNAPNEAECAKYLEILLEKHALPMMETVLRGKVKSSKNSGFPVSREDFEDLGSDCAKSAVSWLRKVKVEAKEIKDFRAYLAKIAYNAWNNFVRRCAPNRERLKNEIRYALEKFSKFKTWCGKDNKICAGLSKFGETIAEISAENLIEQIKTDFPHYFTADLADLLNEIFDKAKAGLSLSDLIFIVAELWNVRDFPTVSLESENNLPIKQGENFEMRFDIKQVWREIKTLAENQRIALLYNLRDSKGREMLFQFFNLQIASLAEIAETMNLSREEFAKLLPLLPLSDRQIAERMNLTEKQIGNLRKTARENLERRLDGKQRRGKSDKLTTDKHG